MACEKGSGWAVCLQLFHDLRPWTPDGGTYNALLAACATGQRWQLAVQKLRRMAEDHLEPEIATYTSVLYACRS